MRGYGVGNKDRVHEAARQWGLGSRRRERCFVMLIVMAMDVV